MIIAITFSLLLITAIVLGILRLSRPIFSYAWPIVVVGSFLAWISTFLWQMSLPVKIVLFDYRNQGTINYSFSLSADGMNFPYALGITSLLLTATLVCASRAREANPLGWISMLVLSIVGLLAVLADNSVTLVIAWVLLDIAGLIGTLNAGSDLRSSKSAVLAFSARMVGIGLMLWAGILTTSSDATFTQSEIPENTGDILILAILIRSVANLIRLPFSKDPAIRHEFESFYQLVSVSVTLVLLSHMTLDSRNPVLSSLLIISFALIGMFMIYHWFRYPRETASQPYWMTGLIALAIAASLLGNPTGSAAWGSATLFSGGLLFLYTARNRILSVVLIVAAYSLSTLPFSLTSTAWQEMGPNAWIILVFMLPLQSFLTAGYVRSILKDEKKKLDLEPRWVKVFYPIGLAVLASTALALGITGWVGAGNVGAVIPALIAAAITVTLSIVLTRISVPPPMENQLDLKPATWAEAASSIALGLFNATRRLIDILTATFEGDGGFLWTILLLIVFVSILGSYAF